MMASASKTFAAIRLILAGLYQWTPLKDVCLRQCQAPLGFILSRGGFQGAATSSLMLGFRHGVYCIGCCWALMVLLFGLGVMIFSGLPRSLSSSCLRKSCRQAV
jgi:predicted metal-binding membrane protein